MLPRALSAAVATGLVATLLGALPSAPAYAANPVTPGNFTGYGFDQCDAPSQSAMSTWIKKSPFRAAGIYISGNSRACRTQSNLTPTWVKNQLAAGWHLMPITLGPQAACSTRYPRYGKNIDPTIIPSRREHLLRRAQPGPGRGAQGRQHRAAPGHRPRQHAVLRPRGLQHPGSTTCTNSALWYLTAWTRQLHDLGYASGYYSSAASGIRMMDDHRVAPNNPLTMPDQVWIADWNGKANTSSSYIRSDGWLPYGRMKQYQGGHNETYGGVTDQHRPQLPQPADAEDPRREHSGAEADSRSGTRGAEVHRQLDVRRALHPRDDHPPGLPDRTTPKAPAQYVVPLQCLLKQQHLYKYEVTGKWNSQTTAALYSFQGSIGFARRRSVTRPVWTALVTHGNSRTLLRVGMTNADAVRVQRAMNAALASGLAVSGTYRPATATAVKAYQRRSGLPVTGTVTAATWAALERGRT